MAVTEDCSTSVKPAPVSSRLQEATSAKQLNNPSRLGHARLSTMTSNTPPKRQYYNPQTNIPLSQYGWTTGSDNDQADESWLHKMQTKLLDDFDDVSSKEKTFMELWNQYIRCHHVITDKDMGHKCMEFVRECGKTLKVQKLRLNFLLHLFN